MIAIAGFLCLALEFVALLIGIKTTNMSGLTTATIFAIVYGSPLAAACYLFTLAAGQ
jgi:hypothetical protein